MKKTFRKMKKITALFVILSLLISNIPADLGGIVSRAVNIMPETQPVDSHGANSFQSASIGDSAASLSTEPVEQVDHSQLDGSYTLIPQQVPAEPGTLVLPEWRDIGADESESTRSAIEGQLKSIESGMSMALKAVAAAAAPSQPELTPEALAKVPPYFYKKTDYEQINLNTGGLIYTDPAVSIPGKNGLDLNLTAKYNSNDANQYDIRPSQNSEYTSFWSQELAYTVTHQLKSGSTVIPGAPPGYSGRDVYDWADMPGFIKSIPVTTTVADFAGRGINLVQTFSGRADGEAAAPIATFIFSNITAKPMSELGVGWSFNFSKLEKQILYNHPTVTDYWILHRDDDSTVELIKAKSTGQFKAYDKFGKVVSVQENPPAPAADVSAPFMCVKYDDGKSEYFNSSGYLVAIFDRFNNYIKFEYTGTQLLRITDTAKRVTTFTYSTSGTQKLVTLTMPDSSTIVYTLAPTESGSTFYKLVSKKDQLNRVTTYAHSLDEEKYRFFIKGKSDWQPIQKTLNLTKITFPTGARSEYVYEKVENVYTNLVDTIEYFRLNRKYDVGSDGVVYNNNLFTYSKRNYMDYKTFISGADTMLCAYSVKISDDKGLSHQYIFSDKGKLQESTYSSTTLVNVSNYENNDKFAPTKITTKQFEASSTPLESIYLYEYNSLTWPMKITASWGPISGGVKTADHKISYTYNSVYSDLASKTYKKDAATTIVEEYTPTSNNKSVAKKYIKQNGAIKEQTDYTYDSFGNVLSELRYSQDTSSTPNVSISYNYNDSNSNYNGLNLREKRVTGVADVDGQLVPTPNGAGVIAEKYTYDIMGRVLTAADASNSQTSYEYDKLGRLKKQTNPDSTTQQNIYDDANNALTTTDENNHSAKAQYDGFGNLLTITRLDNNTVIRSYKYDNYLRLTEESTLGGGVNGSKTAYSYDLLDRETLKKTTNSSSAVLLQENYVYSINATGGTFSRVQKSVLGASGVPTIVTFEDKDNMGYLRKQGYVSSGDKATVFTNDYVGNRLTSLTPEDASKSLAFTEKYEYDHAGRPLKVYNALNNYAVTTYDAFGNITTFTDMKSVETAGGYSTTYKYDSLGRLLRKNTPFEKSGTTVVSSISKHYYDPTGNVTLEKATVNKPGEAEKYNQTGYEYNNRNRLTLVTSFEDGSAASYTKYEYDGVGNMVKMYAGLNSPNPSTDDPVTLYKYNYIDNLEKITDPLNQAESYTFDNLGNMLTKTDRNGTVTGYKYDGLGRTTEIQPSGFPAANFSYTLTGTLASESNGDFSATYTYDNVGRVIAQTESGGIVKSFTYDLDNKRKSFFIKVNGVDKLSNTYDYDTVGRLWNVYDNGRKVGTYTYDTNGSRATLTNGNGTNVSYQYNLANLPTSLANKQGSSVISSYNYAYQLDGNQISKTDNSGKVTTYSYDGLGRLKSEAETGGVSLAYQYDTFSNRKKLTATGSDVYTVDYTYDKNNRLMNDIKTKGQITETTTYDYDKNGNQIFKSVETLAPEGTTQSSYVLNGPSAEYFEYDGFGRMVSAFAGGKNMQYKYRPDGLRLSKSDGVSTTTHIWDGQNMAMELDGTGAMTAKYVRGINILESEDKTGTRKTYMYNAHGDVVQLAGATGQVLWKYDYDAFGVERPIAGQDPELDKNTWRYCGEYYDTETGTVYLRARNYEALTGRFTQQDGWGYAKYNDPLSLNLYTYGNNNPMMYSDPSGHFVIAIPLVAYAIGLLGAALITTAMLSDPNVQRAFAQAAREMGYSEKQILNDLNNHPEKVKIMADSVLNGGLHDENVKVAKKASKFDQSINAAPPGPPPDGGNGDKPSLKKVDSKEAERIAKDNGYKDAHAMKQDIVGKNNISKYDIKINTKTGEIFLEGVKNGTQIATGMFK